MKFKSIVLFSLVLFICVQTMAQKKKWTSLFDGKTTKGWHTYGETTAGQAWKVEDGVLFLDATTKEGRGDIATDESFDDFDRAKAKSILGSIFTGAVAGIKDYTNKVKMKPVAERTPEEQRLLDAEKTANKYAVDAGKQSFLQEYGFFVILILVVVLWLKYK